jgi:hypothetical protein
MTVKLPANKEEEKLTNINKTKLSFNIRNPIQFLAALI